MLHVVPPHDPLESNADRREAVRRRATPTLVPVTVATFAVLVVGLATDPSLVVVALATFAAGLVVGRRL
jgi:hypothetical protein